MGTDCDEVQTRHTRQSSGVGQLWPDSKVTKVRPVNRITERAAWAAAGAIFVALVVGSFVLGQTLEQQPDPTSRMPCDSDEALIWNEAPTEEEPDGEVQCVHRGLFTVYIHEKLVVEAGATAPMPCTEDEVLVWDEHPTVARCKDFVELASEWASDREDTRDRPESIR